VVGCSRWAGVIVYGAIIALLVAVYFAVACLYRAPRPPQARIGLGGTLRLVWFEYWTLAGAAFRMLFYRRLVPDPAPGAATLPVLLVHGVLCNAGVFATLARWLRARGIGPVYALSYGPPLASIEGFADQLAERIDAIRRATGAGQVVLVTHSMGGLVALAYMRKHGDASIRRWIAIGAPFKGSVHACCMIGTSVSQLRPGNPWLAALDARAPAGGPPVVSVWSWHDSMVAPQTSSILDGARNEPLVGIGHNALLRDPEVFAIVQREYAAATAAATSVCPA
jgi:triacylglycerol esterase/lipase EstA (alpha/beta hydrolase family)